MKHLKYNRTQLNDGTYLCQGYIITTISDDSIKIPCFHIIDSETLGKRYDCVISLQKPTYLDHVTLTVSLKKHMLTWLNKRIRNCFDTSTISGWKNLCFSWCGGNSQFKVLSKRPSYETLFVQ